MDFTLTEEHTMLQALAREILEKELTPQRLAIVEATDDCFDRELYGKLAEASLLGVAIPEAHGGMGFGFDALCLLLGEIGRSVAPVPALPTLVLGALAIDAFGTEAQKTRWLKPVATGATILTGALEDCYSDDAARPATRARRDGDAWVLDGRKRHVRAMHLAERFVVPASTDDGVGLFLVDPGAAGVELVRGKISTGEPLFEVRLTGVRVAADELIGGDTIPDGANAAWLHDRALAAVSATQVGVCERALEITAAYARERIQFGVPIGSFQAVQHRLADCYIDLESMRWTTWRAAWKLARGEAATREVTIAKFWAADAGSRIVNATQHVHAGMGVDLDYPIHRYFLWSKALELSFGSATPQLARLGRAIAAESPQEAA